MSSAKSLPSFTAFGVYPTFTGAAEATVAFWTEYAQTASKAALWWTERWLQAPAAFGAWARTTAPAAKEVVEEPAPAPAPAPVEVADVVETVAAPEVVAEAVADAVEAAQPVMEAVVEEAEDLTLLVGIGPKLAAALAARGVSRFAQIAAWSEADLAEVDKALDLKGRAVRDAWVAQAKRFSIS